MAVQDRNKHKKKTPFKGYRAPKHVKKVRHFDLAPSEAKRQTMTRKEREIHNQVRPGAQDVKRMRSISRKADTRGLYDPKTSKNTSQKIDYTPVEFKTTLRENESIDQYEHRLKMEELRITKSMSGYEHKNSERRLDYKRDRRADKADRKRHKSSENEKDLDFTGRTEHIAFGEVVERPPTFGDLQLPGETLKIGGIGKGSAQNSQMSNLEKLQLALKSTNSSIKTVSGDNSDDDDDSGDETTDPLKLSILAQKKKEKQAEREKLLKIAREKQREVDLEKARLQAQAAYRQLKNKRGGESGTKVHMGTLTSTTKTIYQAGVKAMRDLHSVDGGVYHHGR